MIYAVSAIAYPVESRARAYAIEQNPDEFVADLPYLGIWESREAQVVPIHIYSDQDDLPDALRRLGWRRPATDDKPKEPQP